MSNLKQQLARARAQYGSVRYDGDLARDLGLTQPRARWWIPGSALLAAAAVLAMVFLLRDAEQVTEPAAPVTIVKIEPTPGDNTTPAVAVNQNDTDGNSQDATLAHRTADETKAADSTELSISFENFPGIHSVSAGISALGGFSALEWNTAETSQTSTTQESAS